MEENLELQSLGDPATTFMIPMVYDTVLRRAHARTFNLQSKLKHVKVVDEEVEAVLKTDNNGKLFG